MANTALRQIDRAGTMGVERGALITAWTVLQITRRQDALHLAQKEERVAGA